MPIRKKIGQIFRRISGMPSVYVSSSREAVEKPTPTVSPANPPSQNKTEISTQTDTTPELVLYGRSSCPYCLRVDRVIEELGVEDKITRRHTGYGTEWRADLRNRTGSTQVPCLFIDGEPMFESLDIIAWMRANLT